MPVYLCRAGAKLSTLLWSPIAIFLAEITNKRKFCMLRFPISPISIINNVRHYVGKMYCRIKFNTGYGCS